MLQELFKGKSKESQMEWQQVCSRIGDKPDVAWYPSAGLDFRDLLEVCRTEIIPNIHIHTDYHFEWNKLKVGEIFNDNRTIVTINKIDELEFNLPINYTVNSDYVDFPNAAPKDPKIYLFDVEVKSFGSKTNTPVLYIFMENINFLDEVILKHKVNISHLIKIREGMAWGGNKKSISMAYAFLSVMNTKHLLIDNSVPLDYELVDKLANKHKTQLKNYSLRNIPQRRNISNWSGLKAKVVKVESISSEELNRERLQGILKVVSPS